MMTSILLAALLAAAPETAPGPAPGPVDYSRLTEDHKAALRCAAVFAVAAGEQERGSKAALDLPPLAYRGRAFFTRESQRVVTEAGIPREAVRDLIVQNVAEMQQQAAALGNPDTEMQQVVRPCLPRLDKAVAPLLTPSLLQCSAILSLASDEVRGREGMNDRAKDLLTLAYVLKARAREAQILGGKSGTEADLAATQAREAITAEAADDDAGGVNRYDIEHCYDLARPDGKKSHY